MSKESKSAGSATTLGLLGVAFVVLKLTGVIDWSWWWVTLPFWGGLALVSEFNDFEIHRYKNEKDLQDLALAEDCTNEDQS